jgi:beta-glucosidase-like glycosyl hydrolase
VAHADHEAPLRALQAGADQLLVPAVGSFTAAVDTIRRAVDDGELSVERLDQSVERILRLKEKSGLFDDPLVEPEAVAKTVGSREHQQHARRLLSTVQS